MSQFQWRSGNQVTLCENGDEFFPRVFQAVRNARFEVIIETFIVFNDEVGRALQRCLIQAAKRGVRVELTVDGYGSAYLPYTFFEPMTAAGVCFRIFDPRPRVFGMRTNIFRRMHRKLAVVDRTVAFVGGINYAAYHLESYSGLFRQDYAVELTGPVVEDIHQFVSTAFRNGSSQNSARRRQRQPLRLVASGGKSASGDAGVLFVTRGNDRYRTDIERQYRAVMSIARKDILIANAYFFPGYRLFRDLRRAAARGVRVRLLLQGQPDMPWVQHVARLLYKTMIKAGIEIYEYSPRPFHGKVAVVDDAWSTVGSSNLDPLSLSLNLEANVFVSDRALNQHLRSKLECLLEHHSRKIDAQRLPERGAWSWLPNFMIFHFLRHFPALAGWLPAHTPNFVQLETGPDGAVHQRRHPLHERT